MIDHHQAPTEAGLTTIEFMVALVFGVFLLAGVAQVYLTGQVTYRAQDNLARLYENARFIHSFLSRELRMAGFQGDPITLKPMHPVEGAEGREQPDSFRIRYESAADCAGTDTSALPYAEQHFQVQDTRLVCNGLLIAENVEDMQIVYGEDIDGDFTANRYVPADAVSNQDNVVSMRLAMLLRSEEPVLEDAQTYEFQGKTFAASQHIRRPVELTVNLRNQSP